MDCSFRLLFLVAAALLGSVSCSGPVSRTEVVSNASTPVQVLQVKVGRHVDLNLPRPVRGRWWTVESGARPWLQAKTESVKSRIRLFALKPGKTDVVCVLRDSNVVYRKVVVAVVVEKAGG